MTRAPVEIERGIRHPVSPFKNPIGSAGSTGCRQTGMSTVLLGRGLRHRNNGYDGAAFGFGAVFDASFDQCKKRMVLADADVLAGVPLGAALAHDDVAGKTMLTAETLHAQALASRVAPVARRSACLLVSHLGLLVGT